MKSRTKPALRVVPAAHVQLSLPIQGVLQDVKHAFYGLCINAGKQVSGGHDGSRQDRAVRTQERAGSPIDARCVAAARAVPLCWAVSAWASNGRVHAAWMRREMELPSFAWAAGTDPLDAATMAAIAAGVSMRRYASTLEELPPPEKALSVSKSATSRRFVALSEEQLAQWLSRSLEKLDLPVVMIDGIHFRDRIILVALGIDAQGNKHVLGLREGSTESTRVVRSLLSDLVERGLDADRPRLWVIDGGKALRRAIVECFGVNALIQRCQEHKRRNVIEHLPEELHASVGRALRDAWDSANAELAKKQLQRLATSLHSKHPGAAASLREGLEETLTVQGLGITGALYRTLRTTNPIENLNGSIAHYSRNVKRWRDGQMTLRWVASALSDAKDRFRKLRGYRDMKQLTAALTTRVAQTQPAELKAA